MGVKHPRGNEVRKIVALKAQGKTVKQIEELTGRSKTSIATAVKRNPELLSTYREAYNQRIAQEAHASVERLVKLRDQSKHLPTSLGATRDLLDRFEDQTGGTVSRKVTMVINLNNTPPKERDVIDVEAS